MKNNIYRSAAQVTAFSTVEKGLSFLYRIILTRILGAEGLGIYQICLSVFAVFLTAASSGIPVTVSRLMAKSAARGDVTGKHAAVTAGVLCTLCVTVPFALILFFGRNAFSFLFADERCGDIFVLLLPGLILTSVYAVIRGSFWGNKQFLPYSVIELLEDAVMVITGTVLIWKVTDPVAGALNATIAVLVSYIFSFTVSLIWYFKSGGKFVNPKSKLKPLIASAAPITAMRTSGSLLNSAVAVILPVILINACGYTSSEAVSLYGVAAGMAIPMLYIPNSFIGSIAVVVAPELSGNYYKGKKNAVKYDIEKSVKAAIFIATMIIPLLAVLGGAISVFLYDSVTCGYIVQISSFIVLPISLTMMTNTILNSLNCERRTLVYFFIGAAVMILCIVTLTPFTGIYAYVLGLALDSTITAVLNMRLLKKKCPEIQCFKYALKGLTATGVCCIFGTTVLSIVSAFSGEFWQIAICAPLIIIFALGMQYCIGTVTLTPLKKLFKGKKE